MENSDSTAPKWCSFVGLRWWAGVSRACVPSMVSCSSFGLPIHAQPLRLLEAPKWCCTKLQRDEKTGKRCNSANNGRKPQKAHSKMESQPTSADQQCKNRSTQTRPQAASHDKKHRMRTEAARTEQHTQHQTALGATKAKA